MCDDANVISIRPKDTESLILDLCGFISANYARPFEVTIQEMKGRTEKKIALNFKDVAGIDRLGIKQLFIFCTLMRKLNRHVTAYGLNSELIKVFTLMRMDNLMRACMSEDHATGVLN